MSLDNFNWGILLVGIQFLLGLQLILISGIHLFYKSKNTRIPLALLCLLLGLWFFKVVFEEFWEDNLLLFILIGPGKPIFATSLLLFYYKSLSQAPSTKYILRHLLAPICYYVSIIVFRFFLIDNFTDFNQILSVFFSVGVLIIFWYYFFLTQMELIKNVKKKLIPKAYKKVLLLFYSLYFFLLQVPIWDILNNIFKASVLYNDFLIRIEYLYKLLFRYLGEYLSYGYLHLLGYFLFIYALSEVPYFKRFFLPSETLINVNTLRDKEKIDMLIQQHFGQNKLFRNPELTLNSCARILNISSKELIDYLKITDKGALKDYLNKLRVEEFKLLLTNEEFAKYDLVGLAKEAGFKSKSTFYRVFKDIEGLSPNKFKKTSVARREKLIKDGESFSNGFRP